ncbi:MAG: ferrochelatase [Pseudohongiellaceae bacterium]
MKAVLLVNLGTPAAPTAKALRHYYRYFFSDPFVFDIPAWGRWMLRNLIIKPFRAPRTARQYEAIWLDGGSPLKVYTDRLRSRLEDRLHADGRELLVVTGMAYSEPFIGNTMEKLEQRGVDSILVLPLFPQYSSATTASVFHAVRESAARWKQAPELTFITDLTTEPAFIRAWTQLISRYMEQDDAAEVEHVIFSYHGMPEKAIRKADHNQVCRLAECCDTLDEKNRLCYRAQCMETTRAIIGELAWSKDYYSVAFQSRFGRAPWIQPYLDEHIGALVQRGIKRVAVVTPSFVSDCLETIFEIGVEYRHLFEEQGGEQFLLIPNLNDDPAWFDAVAEIVSGHLESRPA